MEQRNEDRVILVSQTAPVIAQVLASAHAEPSSVDKKFRLSARSCRPQPLTSAMPPAMLFRHIPAAC